MKSPIMHQTLRTGRFPLLGAAVALGGGIGFGDFLGHAHATLFATLAVLFLLAAVFLLAFGRRERKLRSLSGGLLLASLLFAGAWRGQVHHFPQRADYFARGLADDSLATSLVQITDIRTGDKSIRVQAEMLALVSDSGPVPKCGKLLVYLYPSHRTVGLQTGDQLLLRGAFVDISAPKNPYAFDGRAYWARKHIFHRKSLVDRDSWQKVGAAANGIYARASQLRDAWQNSLRPYLRGPELAVASALLLGKKDLLDEDIRNAYADTGAIHVLAVSGLHVGIVNLLLGFVFGLFRRTGRTWKWLQIGCTLAGIWGFALLTGFSPSVQRAAVMFSVLAFGRLTFRRAHLFNGLAAAAVVILAYDPLQLFQPGFQLSFAAVAGIGLFQGRLNGLLRTTFRPLSMVWSAMAVSIAATLGTLPFSLFYFHQFPLYFMFTGSLVVLTAFAIMVVGIAHVLCFTLLTPLAGLSGVVLQFVVSLQNGIVFLGRQLPGARQETAWISSPQLWLLLAAIMLFGVWLRSHRFRWIITSFAFLLVFFLFGYRSSKELDEQQRTVLYSLRSGMVMDVVQGRRATRITAADPEPVALKYATENHQSARGYALDTILRATENYPVFENDYLQLHPPFVATASANGLVLEKSLKMSQKGLPIKWPEMDFLLVNNGRHIEKLSQTSLLGAETKLIVNNRYFKPGELPVLSSVDNDLPPIHDLQKQGAIVLE